MSPSCTATLLGEKTRCPPGPTSTATVRGTHAVPLLPGSEVPAGAVVVAPGMVMEPYMEAPEQ